MIDHASHDHGHPPIGVAPVAVTVKDPVCGMNVTPGLAKGGSAVHAGHEHWFCNPKCREKFVADPSKYLAPSTTAEAIERIPYAA